MFDFLFKGVRFLTSPNVLWVCRVIYSMLLLKIVLPAKFHGDGLVVFICFR